MRELVMSLVASVIAGSAVWLGQRLLRYHRVARKRAFFGVSPATDCLLVPPRHFSSPQPQSVHRRDMVAVVELATIVNACGRRIDIVADERAELHALGRATEFCLGGPSSNPRTAAHLDSVLPGIRFEPIDQGVDPSITVGSASYQLSPKQAYVVLARAHLPAAPRPLFVVAGQVSTANLAAARFLATRYRRLLRDYGASGRFCLVLRIVDPAAYGPDFVEVVADVTDEAFRAHEPPATAPVTAGR